MDGLYLAHILLLAVRVEGEVGRVGLLLLLVFHTLVNHPTAQSNIPETEKNK